MACHHDDTSKLCLTSQKRDVKLSPITSVRFHDHHRRAVEGTLVTLQTDRDVREAENHKAVHAIRRVDAI